MEPQRRLRKHFDRARGLAWDSGRSSTRVADTRLCRRCTTMVPCFQAVLIDQYRGSCLRSLQLRTSAASPCWFLGVARSPVRGLIGAAKIMGWAKPPDDQIDRCLAQISRPSHRITLVKIPDPGLGSVSCADGNFAA